MFSAQILNARHQRITYWYNTNLIGLKVLVTEGDKFSFYVGTLLRRINFQFLTMILIFYVPLFATGRSHSIYRLTLSTDEFCADRVHLLYSLLPV
jgi:hypothetical protein